MSDAQHKTAKKPKRRSFWEPESEKLVAWLNDQSDLGTSLELIIVDALHKYGEGDVIKSYLRQREEAFYQNEPQSTPKQPVREPIQQVETSVEQAVEESPTVVEEVVADSEPEIPIDIEEPELESDYDEDDEPFDIDEIVSRSDDESPSEEKEPEYDPLSIMFQDSGSTFNK